MTIKNFGGFYRFYPTSKSMNKPNIIPPDYVIFSPEFLTHKNVNELKYKTLWTQADVPYPLKNNNPFAGSYENFLKLNGLTVRVDGFLTNVNANLANTLSKKIVPYGSFFIAPILPTIGEEVYGQTIKWFIADFVNNNFLIKLGFEDVYERWQGVSL